MNIRCNHARSTEIRPHGSSWSDLVTSSALGNYQGRLFWSEQYGVQDDRCTEVALLFVPWGCSWYWRNLFADSFEGVSLDLWLSAGFSVLVTCKRARCQGFVILVRPCCWSHMHGHMGDMCKRKQAYPLWPHSMREYILPNFLIVMKCRGNSCWPCLCQMSCKSSWSSHVLGPSEVGKIVGIVQNSYPSFPLGAHVRTICGGQFAASKPREIT